MVSRTFTLAAGAEPKPEIKAHFESTPWAAKFFDDSSFLPFEYQPRSSGGHRFIRETLATKDTIAAWQSFYKPPVLGTDVGELYFLLSVGSNVDGHPNKAHGGFIAVVLDEVLGCEATYHCPPGKTTMTAYLTVTYKRPLDLPRVVLCRAWLEDKSSGKKLFCRGTIEDGEGGIYASGDGLWLEMGLDSVKL